MEIARPLAGFRTLLTATSPDGRRRGSVAGVFSTDGREELVLAFSYDVDSTQLQVLAPGLVAWVTRGVHLGLDRSYLAVHVDDVLLPNVRWVPGVHCTPGADCPSGVPAPPLIRMTADDVAYAVDWQRRAGFRLDLVFNGAGSVAADAGHGTDPLTAALTAAKDEFGWINHTWSHKYLGCVRDMSTTPWSCARVPLLGWTRFVSGWAIESEVDRNIDFARQHGLPIDPTELVTGEHSGLKAPPQMVDDNPRLAGALQASGIRTLAADASVEDGVGFVGDAVTVPRYPIDLDFDTATTAETIDQYNWVHTSRADGGDGECESDGGCLPPAKPGTGFADEHRADRGPQGPRARPRERPSSALRPPAPADRGPHVVPGARPGDRGLPRLVRGQPATGDSDHDPVRSGAGPATPLGRRARERAGAGLAGGRRRRRGRDRPGSGGPPDARTRCSGRGRCGVRHPVRHRAVGVGARDR